MLSRLLSAVRRGRPRGSRVGLLAFLSSAAVSSAIAMDDSNYAAEREAMVRDQIEARGIRDARVRATMRKVPRHRFVPEDLRARAYSDGPLPIGRGQTISQPYIVALMTELVRPKPTDRALEIGTGSGYQAAVLAQLVQHVYTIELEESLARQAEAVLRDQKYDNITVRAGDGYAGWQEHAPFDVIVVTAAPDHVPQPLIDQLKPGGRLVVPVGPTFSVQQLQLIEKDAAGKVKTSNVSGVMFVPLRRAD
jgi:protein-L-isoaspartate(D-aspartate) O-methyltransferase